MEEVSEKGFVTFGDFYSEIRTHFSRNTVDFEEFKRRSSGKKKIEFLLDHSIVQEGLRKLSETGGSVKDRKVEEVLEPGNEPETDDFPAVARPEGFRGSEKYPQLSQKVLVQDSKKKGRHLVAKEKINPGNGPLLRSIVASSCRIMLHCLW